MRKDTRIEFRSSPQEKDLLILAAEITGLKVSAFTRNAAIEAANDIIEANETIKLSKNNRDLFLQALETPPKPSSTLKKAMKKYKKWI